MKALNQLFLIIFTLLAYVSETCAELSCSAYAYGLSPQIDVPGGKEVTSKKTNGKLVVSMELPDSPEIPVGGSEILNHPSCVDGSVYARIVLSNAANTDYEWICLPLWRDFSRKNYYVGTRSVSKGSSAWLQTDHKFAVNYDGTISGDAAYVSPVIISISNEPVVTPLLDFKGTFIASTTWALQDYYQLDDIGPGESTTIELPHITGLINAEGRITQTGYSGPDAAIYINGERLTTSKVSNDDPVTVKVVAGERTGHYEWNYNVELECD